MVAITRNERPFGRGVFCTSDDRKRREEEDSVVGIELCAGRASREVSREGKRLFHYAKSVSVVGISVVVVLVEREGNKIRFT